MIFFILGIITGIIWCLLWIMIIHRRTEYFEERKEILKAENNELELRNSLLHGQQLQLEDKIDDLQEEFKIIKKEKLFLDFITEKLRANYKVYNDELYKNYDQYRNFLQKQKEEKIRLNQKEIEEKTQEFFNIVEQKREIAAQNLLLMEEKLLLLQKTERAIQEEKNNRESNKLKNKLNINEKFQSQIKGLWAVCDQLPNPLPLFKAIYDIYFKTEVSDLINRTSATSKMGIYKITNTTNDRIYIGQSTNIGDRWKQHIKRGTGAEKGTMVGEKLYKAMFEDGIWNFSFEILEIVEDKDNLNDKEKYWINYFSTKEFGYNMKN